MEEETMSLGLRKPSSNIVKDSKSSKLNGHKNLVDDRHRCELEKPVDDLRIQIDEQEVKEDLVKPEKMEVFITEKAPHFILLMIIGFFLVLVALIFQIKSVSVPLFDPKSCPTQSNFPPMRISVSPGKVHQVFLNFRGEQLRYNFVSHLSDALQRHDIDFFIDKFEKRGKDLRHLLVRIEESSIALAIFSSRYPESKWCLHELVKMKKLADQRKLRVIPIFYKVEAEDVRRPRRNSEFGQAFWKLAEASTGEQIKEWKEALESISNKMGLSVGDESSEADFVYEIVTEVKRVRETIGFEEEEEPFWGRKINGILRNLSY